MRNNDYNKRVFSLISIFVSIFVYTGTLAIYFYANGWRLGDGNQLFVKTGVLTVESDPFLANLYINGDSKGRTPKSVSLGVGQYDISVYKSGYLEWRKAVEIKEQKSTPIYPWLIKEEIVEENIFLLQGNKYINSWRSEYDSHIYFLVNEYLPESLVYRYSLYRFDTNTAFWDIGSNPRVVLTFDFNTEPFVELLLSPNGLLGVLTLVENEGTKYYLLDATRSSTLNTLSELDISYFSSYDMSWAKNNQYLMFDSMDDLVSFDITKQTRYLLLKKVNGNKYIWSTDEQGFFYKIELNPDYDFENVYSYILVQEQMDGTSPKILIRDLFFQKNQDFILKYMEDTGDRKYSPFTNSPESTKTVGQIQTFVVNQNAKGVYIGTDTSVYWYSIENKKYFLISPYFSELVRFSPDSSRLIFNNIQGYSVFTFLKDEGDHTTQIGAKRIGTLGAGTSDIYWLFNSLNVWYTKDNSMYIADIDGENEYLLLKDTSSSIFHTITSSGQKIVTLSVGEETTTGTRDITINSYTIH